MVVRFLIRRYRWWHQQAAFLVKQDYEKGMVKTYFGTGAFLL